MTLKLFLLLGILFLSQALGKNVVCKKGKVNTKVTINNGDSFTFSTSGKQYAAKMNCKAAYKLGSCKKASVSCSKFQTVVTSKCKRGDRVQLKIGKTNIKRFCGKEGPKMDITQNFYLQFLSDSKKSSKGIKCTVQCQDEETTTKPTTTTPGSSGSCKCGLAKRSSKIVGGVNTEVNEYPWQVALVRKGWRFSYCGGSIITSRWILTAAHCVPSSRKPSNTEILAGEHKQGTSDESDMKRLKISRIVRHWKYDKRTTDYDFALIRLKDPINFADNPHIRPVCLPDSRTNTYTGDDAIVTGWGTTQSGGSSSNTLKEVVVQVLSNAACRATPYGNSITDQMLCAAVEGGGKDSCQGDSGGPLVTAGGGDGVTPGQNYDIIGIVSWGSGCALEQYPGVYARVNKQLKWISKHTSGSSTCPRQ